MSSSEAFILDTDPDQCVQTMASLYQSQTEGAFTDFTIRVEGKSIPCHRVVLAAMCPYFKSLFSSGMKEAIEGQVSFQNFTFESFKVILQYLYTSKIEVASENIEDVIEICEHFQLMNLKEEMGRFVCDHLTSENCIGWWKTAEKFDLTSLAKKAKHIMCTQLVKVSKSNEFKTLSFAEVIDYLREEDLVVKDRDVTLTASLNWVSHDAESRGEFLLPLLQEVKLDECTAEGLDLLTSTYSHLLTDVSCTQYVNKSVISKLKRIESGDKHAHLVILGGMKDHVKTANNKCWFIAADVFNSTWKELTTIPDHLAATHSTLCLIPGGFVLLGGGMNGNKVSKYSAKNEQWTDLPPSKYSLQLSGAVYHTGRNYLYVVCGAVYHKSSNCLYVCGGEGNSSGIMHHLDLDTLEWHDDPDRLAGMLYPVVALFNNAIFVASRDYSNDSSSPSGILQRYDIDDKKWEYKCKLPTNLQNTDNCSFDALGCSLVPSKDSLFLVGGLDKICCQYTVETDSWTELTPPPRNHSFGAAFLHHNTIYLLGGDGAAKPIRAIDEYNIEKDEWNTSNLKLPIRLKFFTAGMVTFV